MLELLKVIVRAVVLERDEDGNIIGEQLSEPEALYSVEQYDEWLASVRAQLNGGADGEEASRLQVGAVEHRSEAGNQ